MTAELKYLALVAIFTTLMWLPYVLNVIMVRGVVDAMGYPDNPKPLALWASRMKAAHYNAAETWWYSPCWCSSRMKPTSAIKPPSWPAACISGRTCCISPAMPAPCLWRVRWPLLQVWFAS